MSYKHLAGRLIETQRSMLGEPAIDIARSTEGITVTDDGNVAAVDGDARAAVDELARRYTGMLGEAAENRLMAAAREFEGELVLPPSLGGPEEFDAGHRDPAAHDPSGDGPAARDSTEADSADDAATEVDSAGTAAPDVDSQVTGPQTAESTAPPTAPSGAVSDGGTTRVVSPTPRGPDEVVSPTPGDVGRPDTTRESYERAADDANGGGATAEDTTSDDLTPDDTRGDEESVGSGISLSEPITVDYSVASTVPAGAQAERDLSSVYLMPGDGSGFHAPVTVADAVVDTITDATELGREDLGEFADDIDTERLLATLAGENGETISFQLDVADLTVTFHRSGSLAVH
jgi:hypothetical protein